MKVWQVGVSDCESSATFCICATKEIALREMFRKRDELVSNWKASIKHGEANTLPIKSVTKKEQIQITRDLYELMIKALSHDDYLKWDNYPHEVPWIFETEVIDQ